MKKKQPKKKGGAAAEVEVLKQQLAEKQAEIDLLKTQLPKPNTVPNTQFATHTREGEKAFTTVMTPAQAEADDKSREEQKTKEKSVLTENPALSKRLEKSIHIIRPNEPTR